MSSFRQIIRRLSTNTIRRQNQDVDSVTRLPYNILFCGTDEFALTCFKKVYENKHLYKSIQVLTPPDHQDEWGSRKGKYERVLNVSPVKEFALQNGIRNHEVPPRSQEGGGLANWFENSLPIELKQPSTPSNLLLTCSFGYLIPPTMLNHFEPTKRLNVHPSLLPALRGAAPIQWAIAKGLQKTGVSIQTLKEKFDSGDILAQTEVTIPEEANYAELYKTLRPIAADLLVDTLENLEKRAETAWSQDDAKNGMKPSRAPIIRSNMSEINWMEWTAKMIVQRSKAIGYIYPVRSSISTRKQGVRSNTILREIELYDLEKVRRESIDPQTEIVSNQALDILRYSSPGMAILDKKTGLVLCRCADDLSGEQKDVYLRLLYVQNVGRKILTAEEWANGNSIDFKGSVRRIQFM